MNQELQRVFDRLFCREPGYLYQANSTFANPATSQRDKAAGAFFIRLAGHKNPLYKKAKDYLQESKDKSTASLNAFYQARIADIEAELGQHQDNPEFTWALQKLLEGMEAGASLADLQESIWQVFFPEGAGVFANWREEAVRLRQARRVTLTQKNASPLQEPGREMLFTSNVLLTIPSEHTDISALPYSETLKGHIRKAAGEPQQYWYDHPIPIGVAPEANEILYGLQALDDALEQEKQRGNLNGKVKCLLSVSVTHEGLFRAAKEYIRQELQMHSNLQNLEVFIFTEEDTRQMLEEVLLPFPGSPKEPEAAENLRHIFGVNGAYGRHYSFLKAIAALWSVWIDPGIKATFKIDLDQVFPQKELIEQTGASALEHFKTPLWGAEGKDEKGQPVELGMIAGALVNEKDIHKGLYTPDVPFPNDLPDSESRIFFSKMLMALSTEGEMMTRYNGTNGIDGQSTCIQRIHVTGGTNGIRVDALRKHRPFTPTFIGRAEDQAYILSALGRQYTAQLAYLHQDGLIMRHDKEAFAQEAMENAKLGKMAGDYIRLLYFSKYAESLDAGVDAIKEVANPFTGSFISRIPITVAMLRFVLKSIDLSAENETQADKFVYQNYQRLEKAIAFINNRNGSLKKQVAQEREGWEYFYNILDEAEKRLQKSDPQAGKAAAHMQQLIENCQVR